MQIQIQDLSMTYPSGKQALQRLDLDLTSPSLVGLLGPNGAPAGPIPAGAQSPSGLSPPVLRPV